MEASKTTDVAWPGFLLTTRNITDGNQSLPPRYFREEHIRLAGFPQPTLSRRCWNERASGGTTLLAGRPPTPSTRAGRTPMGWLFRRPRAVDRTSTPTKLDREATAEDLAELESFIA